MWIVWIGAALAGKYDGLDGDVVVERTLPAAPEQAFAYLLDLKHLQQIFPKDCVGSWEFSERSFGEGASVMVRYDIAAMHRTLPMTLVRAEHLRYIDFDHVGPKGFVTRWHVTPAEGGTKIRIETPLHPPPAPFKGYYFNVVRPEWTACYERTLDNLATELAARAASSAPSAP